MFEKRDREETRGFEAFGLLTATAVALLASAGPSLAETVGFETGLFPPGFSWTAEKGTCSVVPRASLPPWPECRQFVEQLSGNVLRCQLETAGGKVRFSPGGPSQDLSVRVFSPLPRGDCGVSPMWAFGQVGVSVWAPALPPGYYFWDGDFSFGLITAPGYGEADQFVWRERLVTRFDVEARSTEAASQEIVIDSISYRPRLPPSVRILTPPLTEIRNGQRFEWETDRDPLHGFLVSVDDPLSDSPGSSQLSSPDLTGEWTIDPRLGANGKVLYWLRPSARSVVVPAWGSTTPVRFTVYAADDSSYPLGVSQLLVPPPRILPASATSGTVTAGAASAEFRVRLRNPSPLNVYGRVAVGAPAEIPVGGAGYLDFLPGAELEARLKFPASALVTPRQISSYISIRSSITSLGEVGRIPFTLNVVGPSVPSGAPPSPASDTQSISTGAAGTERSVDLLLASGASLEVAPQFPDSEVDLSASSVATPGGTLQATLAIRPGNTVAGRQLFVLRSPGTEGSQTLDTHWLNVDALKSKPVEECRRLGSVDIIPSAVSGSGLNGSQFFTDGWVVNTAGTSAEVALLYSADERPGRCVAFTVGAGSTVRLFDVVGTWLSDSGTGLLEVRSESPASTLGVVYVRSRTDGKADARYGGAVAASVIGPEQPVLMPGVEDTTSARANVVLAETAGAECTVLLEALSSSGEVKGAREVSLGAWKRVQINSAVRELTGSSEPATLRLRQLGGGGRISAFASVIENLSNSFGLASGMTAVSRTPVHVPGGARLEGAGGTRYETDLYLANGSSEPALVEVRYRHVELSGTSAEAVRTVTIPPHGSMPSTLARDAISSLLGVDRPSYGWFSVVALEGSVAVRAVLRTVVDPADPARGFRLAALPVAAVVPASGAVSSPGVERSLQVRSNAALVNTSTSPLEVRLSLRDARGALRASKVVSVLPLAYSQITDVPSFLGLGDEPLQDGFLEASIVSGSRGALLATLSRIDNASRNPEVLLLK